MDTSGRAAFRFSRSLIAVALVVAWSPSAMAGVDGSTKMNCTLLVRLRLANGSDLALSRVADEVRAIWKPYLDIQVTDDEASTHCTDEVYVRIDDVSARVSDALGWITFEDGQPTRDIAVSLPRVRLLLCDATWWGRPLGALPRALATQLLSQAVGRAIAHEVGHYVLRSASHEPAGLMRAGFNVRDVIGPRGNRFRLAGVSIQERLAGLAASHFIAPPRRSPENKGARPVRE